MFTNYNNHGDMIIFPQVNQIGEGGGTGILKSIIINNKRTKEKVGKGAIIPKNWLKQFENVPLFDSMPKIIQIFRTYTALSE